MRSKTLHLVRRNGAVVAYTENEQAAIDEIRRLAAERETTLKRTLGQSRAKVSVESDIGGKMVRVLVQTLGYFMDGSPAADTTYDILTAPVVAEAGAAAATR